MTLSLPYCYWRRLINSNAQQLTYRLNNHYIRCYSRITLKSIQCDWDEFFVASVITASKENLYQSQKAITYRFYFELTIHIYYLTGFMQS